MRKTVDEWLMSHQMGAGMSKKRRSPDRATIPPTKSKPAKPTKKSAQKRAKRKPR